MTASGNSETRGTPPLMGAPAWLITEDKAGLRVQVQGVSDALGCVGELKTIRARGLYKLAGPFLGWIDPANRFGQPGSDFAPPWPAIAIGAGMASLPYLRAIRRLAGPRTFTVAVQKSAPAGADVIAAPSHDRCHGVNVVSTLTAPHGYSPARLAVLRQAMPPEIAALPALRVGVLLGGDNGVYRFGPDDLARLGRAVSSIASHAGSFLVTASRRTQPALWDTVEIATRDHPRLMFHGTGVNPYPAILAHADVLVVTADSVNMTGEACATGRPVYVFEPSGGSAKFRRFHESLRECGITRLLPDRVDAIAAWSYTPLDSARIIASEVERRWQRRAHMLAGLMGRQDH